MARELLSKDATAGDPPCGGTVLAVAADGSNVVTVEGVAADGELSAVQQGFQVCHGLQCGFCTPGMVMSAIRAAAGEPGPGRGRDPRRN